VISNADCQRLDGVRGSNLWRLSGGELPALSLSPAKGTVPQAYVESDKQDNFLPNYPTGDAIVSSASFKALSVLK